MLLCLFSENEAEETNGNTPRDVVYEPNKDEKKEVGLFRGSCNLIHKIDAVLLNQLTCRFSVSAGCCT